jgi:hypothetical protein
METAGLIDAAPNVVMLISYCGYIAFLPMIVALVVFGWLIPRNG